MARRNLEGIIFDGESFYGNRGRRLSYGSESVLGTARQQIGRVGLVVPSKPYLDTESLMAVADRHINYGDIAKPMVDMVGRTGWLAGVEDGVLDYGALLIALGTKPSDTLVVTPRYEAALAAKKELGARVVAIVSPQNRQQMKELEPDAMFYASTAMDELHGLIFDLTSGTQVTEATIAES